MNKDVERLFGIKLSKNGRFTINKWIEDEYGSLYYAKKSLDDDTSIIEFINDMLKQDEKTLDDISKKTNLSKRTDKKTAKKKFIYCPYCGEKLE